MTPEAIAAIVTLTAVSAVAITGGWLIWITGSDPCPWIDVKKRMPKHSNDVWVWVRLSPDQPQEIRRDYCDDGEFYKYGDLVSKWAPLTPYMPSPPKGER